MTYQRCTRCGARLHHRNTIIEYTDGGDHPKQTPYCRTHSPSLRWYRRSAPNTLRNLAEALTRRLRRTPKRRHPT